MATEFKLPELGENVSGGDVVSLLVQEGDSVKAEQAVLELETDKATVEVPTDVAGRITKIHISQGDHVEVGQVILSLEGGEAAGEAVEKPQARKAEAKEKGGSEKPSAAPPKAEANTVKKAVDEGREAVEAKPKEAPEPEPARPREQPEPRGEVVTFRERAREVASSRMVAASPAVRRFAREIGVDIGKVSGSGPKGRISVEDVKTYSRELRSQPAGPSPRVAPVALPDFSTFGAIERERFNNIRRVTASRLAEAWANVVHVTNHDRADVTRLEELRNRHASKVEEAGGKLTVTAVILKACAAALKVFPKFNASIDVKNEEIIFKRYCNIGVAVDTPRGLLVPVIRDVERKNIVQLSVELKELAEKARQGKLSPDEMQGGCFTVTNLGGIGGTSFTPVVNFPEVAILGVSRTTVEPVYKDDSFEPRKMLPLSLSYDHRLIDGADAAKFMRWLVEALEEPFFMLLEG